MESNPSPAAAAEISSLGRWLAGAQQLKDTITIVGMNFMLLFGLLFFGLPIPGLILYWLRWRLVRGQGGRNYALRLWGFSFLHEILCAALFASTDMHAELHEVAEYLTVGYLLGAAFSAAGLLTGISADLRAGAAPDADQPASHEDAP
jgi:hypothetical protein